MGKKSGREGCCSSGKEGSKASGKTGKGCCKADKSLIAEDRYSKALAECIRKCKSGEYSDQDYFELIDSQMGFIIELKNENHRLMNQLIELKGDYAALTNQKEKK